TVTSEVDPAADFARYRSFAFYQPLAMEDKGYATMTSNRIKAAARRQMEARGYVYDQSSPHLRVHLNAYLPARTDVSPWPDIDYDVYYSYRARRYVAVPYWRERAQVHSYTEGTLNVDIVDADRNALVWTGAAVGRVGRAADDQARIDAAMAEI